MALDEPVDDELAASLETLIQIDSAHQRLESVAADVAVVGCTVHQGLDMAVESQSVANAVEALALHDLGSCGCEESLMLGGVGLVEEVGDHVVEDGVAQELKSFLTNRLNSEEG